MVCCVDGWIEIFSEGGIGHFGWVLLVNAAAVLCGAAKLLRFAFNRSWIQFDPVLYDDVGDAGRPNPAGRVERTRRNQLRMASICWVLTCFAKHPAGSKVSG